MRLLPVVFLLTSALPAQWDLQASHTTASLRGIHALGGGVAWASGTEGTVLRTTDDGLYWQRCPTPPAAEHLDFRGIQAFDASTALVMSSGKGDLSRLYKTTDGCQSWKLVFTNPHEQGFWDALKITDDKTAYVLGDPVDGTFAMFFTDDKGETWFTEGDPGRAASVGAGAFAASNGAFASIGPYLFFGVGAGTASSPKVYYTHAKCVPPPDKPKAPPLQCTIEWLQNDVPMSRAGITSGVFAIASRSMPTPNGVGKVAVVAVGGTYDKPESMDDICAVSPDGGRSWQPAQTPPHGYRSAVAYAPEAKAWITVGPNGTDLSTDDGRNWRALKPGPTEPPDADRNWNALSLPFAVGPLGRIGRLRSDALPKPAK